MVATSELISLREQNFIDKFAKEYTEFYTCMAQPRRTYVKEETQEGKPTQINLTILHHNITT
jgi:uncharacterized membrane-anchored protein YhcB (DUF1043 family)